MNTTECNNEVQQRVVKSVSTVTNKDYLATNTPYWRYPLLDGEPPKGKKLNLLTSGGIAVIGQWNDSSNFIAWAPLIKASKTKEFMSEMLHDFQRKKVSTYRQELLTPIFQNHLQHKVEDRVTYGNRYLYSAISVLLSNIESVFRFDFNSVSLDRVTLINPIISVDVRRLHQEQNLEISITLATINLRFMMTSYHAKSIAAVANVVKTLWGLEEASPTLHQVSFFTLHEGEILYLAKPVAIYVNNFNQADVVLLNQQ